MSHHKILLIDYDPASINRTATPLTKAGYQVEVAKDGLSGLAAFERMNPSLVLVEAMLPRKHGFEVCQEIKAKPDGKTTPVLITTAVCRGRKYRMDALQIYGCDEYIEKPITDDELLSMIAKFIEQAEQARQDVQQDLSDALDTAAADVPVAIETMDDDELEAKIDALLMGGGAPAEEEILAPSMAPVAVLPEAPAPVAATIPIATEDEPLDTDVDALPAEEVSALPVQEPEAADPTLVEAPVDPFVDEIAPRAQEWTEAPTNEKRGGSKVVLFGVAAVLVLGVVGFLAFQQGWIGGGDASEPLSHAPAESAARLASPMPASVDPAPTFQSAPPEIIEPRVDPQEPANVESEPQEVQPESTEPQPIVPTRPTFKPRSAAELKAARDRQARADRAMRAAAGSLQSQLLNEQADDPVTVQDEPGQISEAVVDDLIGTPVRPKAQRGQLFPLEEVDRAPVPVRFEQPAYDELARRSHQQGVVIVEVLIDETGQVSEVKLVQEIPRSRLNDASVRAARKWTYKPAMKDSVAVMVWKTERIVFELE